MSVGFVPKSYMDDWICEPEDTTVGIFGDSWYHDNCPEEPGAIDDPADIEMGTCTVEMRLYGASGSGLNRFSIWAWRVRCDSCGHAIRWIERDWDPDYPEGM